MDENKNQQIESLRSVSEKGVARHLAKSIAGLFKFVFLPLGLAVLGTYIYNNATATQEIECKVTEGPAVDYLPENINTMATISVKDVAYKDLYFYDIAFWNRSGKNFSDIIIRPTLDGNELLQTVSKLLIYGDDYDTKTAKWTSISDDNWEASLAILNVNWSSNPNFRLRYFFASKPKGIIRLISNQAGVIFVPYREEVKHWWLFGFDTFFEILRDLFLMVSALLALMWMTKKFCEMLLLKQCRNFAKVAYMSLDKNMPDVEASIRKRAATVAVLAYIHSLENPLIWKKNVKTLDVPADLNESGDQVQK
jgi:hypothetical protein